LLLAYTSKELTHFVGASLKPEKDKQFELLLKILKTGILSPYPDNKPKWYNRLYGGPISLVNGEMYPQFPKVCLCDIPLGDLHLHIKKYSDFGLAFPKRILVAKGATPVFYVAQDAPYLFSKEKLADRFVEMSNRFQDFCTTIPLAAGKELGRIPQHLVDLETAWNFMMQQILAYIKVFDSNASDDAADNYYMEREWRVVGGFTFSIEDVSRIIIPCEYARQFRGQVPDYYGELSFASSDPV